MKKFILALCVSLCMILSLTACGQKESTTLEYDEAVLTMLTENLMETLVNLTDEQAVYYAELEEEDMTTILSQSGWPMSGEAFQSALGAYQAVEEVLGDYKSVDNFKFKASDSEVHLTAELTFSERKAEIELIFNKKVQAETISINPRYSTGEILGKAGMNTILGMGTVFGVLILISLIIYCFKYISVIQNKLNKKKTVEQVVPQSPVVPVVTAEEDDFETIVAVITAAIAASSGTSSDDFVVRSIRRSDKNKWKRA